MTLDVVAAFANDFLVWDATESVTFEHTRVPTSLVDGAAVVPGGPGLLPLTEYVSVAKRRAIGVKERMASGGAYVGSDTVWLVPLAVLPQDFTGKEADVIVDATGARWTVIEHQRNRLKLTWRFVCRNLALVFGLRDEINIQRATVSYDAAGAAVKMFPPDGGSTIYQRLAADVQPQQKDLVDERAIRGMTTRYDVVVDREVAVTNEDRILWNGVYLDIIGYRQAERIDELPIVECEQRP